MLGARLLNESCAGGSRVVWPLGDAFILGLARGLLCWSFMNHSDVRAWTAVGIALLLMSCGPGDEPTKSSETAITAPDGGVCTMMPDVPWSTAAAVQDVVDSAQQIAVAAAIDKVVFFTSILLGRIRGRSLHPFCCTAIAFYCIATMQLQHIIMLRAQRVSRRACRMSPLRSARI